MEISEIAKGFLVFNIVPQISRMNTDFFLELGGWGKVTQIAQMTQIFLLLLLAADETYSVR